VPVALTVHRQVKVVDRTHEPIDIPPRVIDAVGFVQRTGWRDMYDRETVMMLAATFGFGKEAEWLVENRHLYFEALRRATRSV
jgi:hypothetical protein